MWILHFEHNSWYLEVICRVFMTETEWYFVNIKILILLKLEKHATVCYNQQVSSFSQAQRYRAELSVEIKMTLSICCRLLCSEVQTKFWPVSVCLNGRLTAAGQLSSSYGSWEPDWRRWVEMPGPSPNSESHWVHSALTWTELSPDSPGAPPMQTCLHCRHSGRSPWSVWTDRWTSGWRKCQGGVEGGRKLI